MFLAIEDLAKLRMRAKLIAIEGEKSGRRVAIAGKM
jgi:hypothetical protein